MGIKPAPFDTSNRGTGFGLATCNHGQAILGMEAHILSHSRAGISSATCNHGMVIRGMLTRFSTTGTESHRKPVAMA